MRAPYLNKVIAEKSGKAIWDIYPDIFFFYANDFFTECQQLPMGEKKTFVCG